MVVIENEVGAEDKEEDHECPKPTKCEGGPFRCEMSVSPDESVVAFDFDFTIEPIYTMMKEETDSEGKVQGAENRKAKAFEKRKEFFIECNMYTPKEDDEANEESADAKIAVHEKVGEVCAHFAHPIAVRLIV